MFETIKQLFAKKLTREQHIHELEKTIHSIDRELAGLDYDCKQGQREVDRIVQKGVQAARKGDTFAREQAAVELRTHKLALTTLHEKRKQAVGGKALAQNTLIKLRSLDPSGVTRLMERVRGLLDSPELTELVQQQDLKMPKLNEWIMKQLEISENQAERIQLEASHEEDLFVALARAEQAGDLEQAAKCRAELSALAPPESGSSKYDGLQVS